MSRPEEHSVAGIPGGEKLRDINAIRRQQSLLIINGIVTYGLQSAESQVGQGKHPFMSGDLLPDTESLLESSVDGRIVIPFDYPQEGMSFARYSGKDLTVTIPIGESLQIYELVPLWHATHLPDYLLDDALYANHSKREEMAIFPVLAERQSEAETSFTEQQDRMQHSILIATPVAQFSGATNGQMNGVCGINRAIVPLELGTILMPEKIQKEIGRGIIKTATPISLVGNISRTVAAGGEFSLPDYETSIKALLEATREPLFLHGVRLPTNRDVARGLI